MNLIIAGPRDWHSITSSFIDSALYFYGLSASDITKVICGEAPGVDQAGKTWAEDNGVQVDSCFANWKELGRAAGHIRNGVMANIGHRLLLIWGGTSPGSRNMKKRMNDLNKPIYEILIKTPFDLGRI